MKTTNIYTELNFNNTKPLITILFETNFTKEIRIVMKKGSEMKKHKTKHPIVIQIIEGQIDFGVHQEIKPLQKGDIIGIEGNVPHDLKAKDDSIIRLTLTKNDDTNRIENIIK